MKTLIIFLLLPIFALSQNLKEFQLVDWDKNTTEYYNQIPGGNNTLKKHQKKYHQFTTNILVNELVNNQLDTLRKQRKLNPTSQHSGTTWVWRVLNDFANGFSDSLNQPVILRQKNSGESCQKCSQSIFDLVREDSTLMSIVMSKKLKKSYLTYFQRSINGDWQTSYLVIYYKMRFVRTRFFYYELPDDGDKN